jgi:hypothetical protein
MDGYFHEQFFSCGIDRFSQCSVEDEINWIKKWSVIDNQGRVLKLFLYELLVHSTKRMQEQIIHDSEK